MSVSLLLRSGGTDETHCLCGEATHRRSPKVPAAFLESSRRSGVLPTSTGQSGRPARGAVSLARSQRFRSWQIWAGGTNQEETRSGCLLTEKLMTQSEVAAPIETTEQVGLTVPHAGREEAQLPPRTTARPSGLSTSAGRTCGRADHGCARTHPMRRDARAGGTARARSTERRSRTA